MMRKVDDRPRDGPRDWPRDKERPRFDRGERIPPPMQRGYPRGAPLPPRDRLGMDRPPIQDRDRRRDAPLDHRPPLWQRPAEYEQRIPLSAKRPADNGLPEKASQRLTMLSTFSSRPPDSPTSFRNNMDEFSDISDADDGPPSPPPVLKVPRRLSPERPLGPLDGVRSGKQESTYILISFIFFVLSISVLIFSRLFFAVSVRPEARYTIIHTAHNSGPPTHALKAEQPETVPGELLLKSMSYSKLV